jgi:glycosyltransferase involved in cell wall biosynthesis
MNGGINSSTPKISVALCTYNGARFLPDQLESIQNQTRAIDELVICDDGSADNTWEIIQASNLPIISTRNPVRLGVTKNFEQTISRCTGEVIFLCDQDDRWRPDKVETLLKALEPQRVNLAFSNAQIVDRDLTPLGYRMWDSIWFDPQEQQQVADGNALPVLLRHAIAAGSTLAFKSKYLPLLLPIPDLPHSHDIWITLLLSCIGRIDPVNEDLIQYRLHGGNEVGMRHYGFIDQIRMARHQIKTHAFAYLAELHEAAYERLTNQTQWPVHPNLLVMLEDKIRHSHRRAQLPRGMLRRLGTISAELYRGNYRKFSYGYKSVLQDLLLR